MINLTNIQNTRTNFGYNAPNSGSLLQYSALRSANNPAMNKLENTSLAPTMPSVYANSALAHYYASKKINFNKIEQKLPVTVQKPFVNDLRKLFQENNAKILAVIPRTMNAQDINGNGLIQGNELHGTFINAIDRLDEIKSMGFNTLHLLPIHPPGKVHAMGTAGSVYAPEDYLEIDPMLRDKNAPGSVEEQFRKFTDECHKRGIRVMLDLPSCASLNMAEKYPAYMAREKNGEYKTPQGWQDIRMFDPWEDKERRILNKPLLDMHKNYIDKYIALGVDGIRADVARAKPVEFWNVIIPYSRSIDPNFGWLAETYTYEDASPQLNMKYDRPEDLLRAGFDMYYGQYHIFNQWLKASNLHDYVKENIEMSYRLPKGKSVLGSFSTHDDESPMLYGGVPWVMLTTGIQSTLPMLNPYFVDGVQTGDYYIYPYANATVTKTATDNPNCTVHHGRIDIFNLSRKPGGDFPEIGNFIHRMLSLRDEYNDIITQGSYIPLKVAGNEQIIAYARHLNGKTLLVVANRNVNGRSKGIIEIPGFAKNQQLYDKAPASESVSYFQKEQDKLKVDLGPCRFHMFEIDTPFIEQSNVEVLKQNL